MSERAESVESFDEFFGSKTDKDDDKEQKQNDPPTSSGVAALIKVQPTVHRRQTPSETKSNKDSKKSPLTPSVKNVPVKTNHIDSPPSKRYESDFDDDKHSGDEKSTPSEPKKHSSLPPPQERLPTIPRRGSDSKLVKASYTMTNTNTRRKEHFLPYIRPQNRRKVVPNHRPKEIKREVELRLLSAQRDKQNELLSRLAELRRQLEEERIENKTLRLIKKREDKALKTYEDQEYDIHKFARDFTHEIEEVKEKLEDEREVKMQLEQEIEVRSEKLQDQTKRVKFYEKLVKEKNLDEPEDLRQKLKETDKKLKQFQDKIANKEKYIDSLEKNYRHEIHEELVKQRDLKHEIETHTKNYVDLLQKFEAKTRQVDTMHIYIQRGGRRPSNTSLSLSKSYSLRSLQDTSPQFRDKIIEYDKKRREQQKNIKPKPRSQPVLPLNNAPPKPERKKYVPNIKQKPKITKPPTVTSHVSNDIKPAPIQNGHIPLKEKAPIRRLPTPRHIEEEKNDIDDETLLDYSSQRSPSPLPTIQRSEQHLSQAPIYKRSLTPVSIPIEPKIIPTRTVVNTSTSYLFKRPELPPTKPEVTRELDDKWSDMFDTDKTKESVKEDLVSKLISDEQEERKPTATTQSSSPPSTPPSKRPSITMFESPSSSNISQKKVPTRVTATSVYDFDQAVINLHEGKPVTAQPTTTTTARTSVDPFESLFGNNTTTKPVTRTNVRDETFTTTETKSDPFQSLFRQQSSSTNNTSIPKYNDKLQRPKIVTNTTRTIPNRTVVEEIEDLVL